MVLEKNSPHDRRSGRQVYVNLDLKCPVIATARLLLRPLHRDDAPDITRLANDFAVASMLSSMPHPYFAEDAMEFIDRVTSPDQGDCVYAITRAQTGEFLGICGLHTNASRHRMPIVGYWLGKPHWGSGYATEAARAMVDLYFKVTDRDSLLVSARIDNAASRRVIEKCGARYWKSGEHYNRVLGQMQKLDHYRITRDDWLAIASRNSGQM